VDVGTTVHVALAVGVRSGGVVGVIVRVGVDVGAEAANGLGKMPVINSAAIPPMMANSIRTAAQPTKGSAVRNPEPADHMPLGAVPSAAPTVVPPAGTHSSTKATSWLKAI
jgi:hypothetical protein